MIGSHLISSEEERYRKSKVRQEIIYQTEVGDGGLSLGRS